LPETSTLQDDLVRALYEEHAGPLLGYVRRLTGDSQRAEDVVQETIIRAWRNPAVAARDHGSIRPWLLVVARNIVIDHARAGRSRPVEVGAHSEQLGTDEGLEAWERRQEVAAAMQMLSEPHREVLLEMYYRERTVVEAATILGVPTGTVKSRTYYALRMLRLALQAGSDSWTAKDLRL
jgi:RNA polymerase sigma-70 factor (ECF subfamily)